jgi:CelD/BcsL family acetyltransferase involved in cellulose biosynthesis
MRVHDDWETSGFDLPAVATMIGPFSGRGFGACWWRHRGRGEVMLAEAPGALLPLCRDGSRVSFVGESDLTDYHSPRGERAAGLVAAFAEWVPRGTRLDFDSMPASAADVVERGLAAAGLSARRTQHEIAAVLDLPSTPDAYVASLSAKQRHELRRKRRRRKEELGDTALVRDPGLFGAFVTMHRSAPGEKGDFMTAEMEAFFSDLLALPESALDVLVMASGEPVAAGLGFEDEDAYYLYNSAFDSGAARASPGVMLVDSLIEQAIHRGRRRFDFLKGSELYKFRLGARVRPLFRLEVVR